MAGYRESTINVSDEALFTNPVNEYDIRAAGFTYFLDEERRVDFILEYVDKGDEDTRGNIESRRIYFENLKAEGLQLEEADLIENRKNHQQRRGTIGEGLEQYKLQNRKRSSNDLSVGIDNKGYGTFLTPRRQSNVSNRSDASDQEEDEDRIMFVKVHAPFDVLCKYAEKTKLKFPIGKNDIYIRDEDMDDMTFITKLYSNLKRIDPFEIKDPQFQEPENYFVEEFRRENLKQYVYVLNKATCHIEDFQITDEHRDAFFTPAQRSRLVEYILRKTQYGITRSKFGYHHMIHYDILSDVYPLHEGPLKDNNDDPPENVRQQLQTDWATHSRIFKYQPISAIREYFGEKIALYFAWLGFYTTFLIPAAVVGFICFLYGIFSIYSDIPTNEVCKPQNGPNRTSLFYMCPLCPRVCPYFLLNSVACTYAKVNRLFDNEATIFFAVFMSLWATLFLEFWKRKQVTLAYQWHTMDFEEVGEQPRPEYKLYANDIRINQVTQIRERYMTRPKQRSRFIGAYTVVIFFFVAVVASVISVIIYSAAVAAVLSHHDDPELRAKSSIIVSITSGILNLIAINVLSMVYDKVSVRLTDWENPRTQTEYEDSYTMKMFWFQFANTYASIFYVAFFKTGEFTGTPGHPKKFAGSFHLEGCPAEGCFIELTIQLIIIMVGQQIIENFQEIFVPFIILKFNIAKSKWLKMREKKKQRKKDKTALKRTMSIVTEASLPQWVKDHSCTPNEEQALFEQYLEIVLQYGFVTMFVAAFPLAPVFALINNLVEIRLDAVNFVYFYRRPVAHRAEDIGAWYDILATLTTFSTIVNAFVLAFTSSAIPRMTYKYFFSEHGSMNGFVNFTLSYFDVKDFTKDYRPFNSTLIEGGLKEQSYCRYPGYYEPHSPYEKKMAYWIILAARLAFVICFQGLVLSVTWFVGYIIPDMPESLVLKLRREEFLAEEREREKDLKLKRAKERKSKQEDTRKYVMEEPDKQLLDTENESSFISQTPSPSDVRVKPKKGLVKKQPSIMEHYNKADETESPTNGAGDANMSPSSLSKAFHEDVEDESYRVERDQSEPLITVSNYEDVKEDDETEEGKDVVAEDGNADKDGAEDNLNNEVNEPSLPANRHPILSVTFSDPQI